MANKWVNEICCPPYIVNLNLKAQKGILSYWKSDLIKEENIFTQQVERIPLDDLLYESGPDNGNCQIFCVNRSFS